MAMVKTVYKSMFVTMLWIGVGIAILAVFLSWNSARMDSSNNFSDTDHPQNIFEGYSASLSIKIGGQLIMLPIMATTGAYRSSVTEFCTTQPHIFCGISRERLLNASTTGDVIQAETLRVKLAWMSDIQDPTTDFFYSLLSQCSEMERQWANAACTGKLRKMGLDFLNGFQLWSETAFKIAVSENRISGNSIAGWAEISETAVWRSESEIGVPGLLCPTVPRDNASQAYLCAGAVKLSEGLVATWFTVRLVPDQKFKNTASAIIALFDFGIGPTEEFSELERFLKDLKDANGELE